MKKVASDLGLCAAGADLGAQTYSPFPNPPGSADARHERPTGPAEKRPGRRDLRRPTELTRRSGWTARGRSPGRCRPDQDHRAGPGCFGHRRRQKTGAPAVALRIVRQGQTRFIGIGLNRKTEGQGRGPSAGDILPETAVLRRRRFKSNWIVVRLGTLWHGNRQRVAPTKPGLNA